MIRFCCLVVLCVLLSGCTAPRIPKSSYPAQVSRVYQTSFERTWSAVLKYIEESRGNVVSENKNAGAISFKTSNKPLAKDEYINVVVNELPDSGGTAVYVQAWFANWGKESRLARVHGAIEESSDRFIFDELDRIIDSN